MGFTANPGGSSGDLCLGGAIGRDASIVLVAAAVGRTTVVIDLRAIPKPCGAAAAHPGETWSFQYWHRDIGPVGPVSNFTNPRAIRFR